MLSQHVSNTHRVEDASGVIEGGTQIHTTVEVQERGIFARAQETGDNPQLDSAVPTDYQRNLASPQRNFDLVGHGPGNIYHRGEILRMPTLRVRPEASSG